MVRRLAFPALPPPPNGMVWSGMGEGGAAVCGEWSGRLGGVGRPGVAERAGILRKPYARHKPYNVGRVPVFISLKLYHPSLNPA